MLHGPICHLLQLSTERDDVNDNLLRINRNKICWNIPHIIIIGSIVHLNCTGKPKTKAVTFECNTVRDLLLIPKQCTYWLIHSFSFMWECTMKINITDTTKIKVSTVIKIVFAATADLENHER